MAEIDNFKLSIIIPYFETFDLTCKLLECLEKQVNKDVEVILIDDGCNEKRLDKYKFAKIIHQENKGVGFTRNKGVQLAKGEYIAFIDSDDIISNDYVETILKTIIYEQDRRDTGLSPEIVVLDWQDLTTNQIHRRPTNFAPWRAIYRKDILPKFLEDKKYGMEDIWFTGEIEQKVKYKAYTDKVIYYYNSNREGSLMWKKARNL